jgi:hypothetical protein
MISRGEIRMAQQRLHHRRHQQGQAGPMGGKCGAESFWREAAFQHDGGAGEQGRRRLDVEAADMEHRQYRQHPVGSRQVVGVQSVDRVPGQGTLGQQRALGPAGGA